MLCEIEIVYKNSNLFSYYFTMVRFFAYSAGTAAGVRGGGGEGCGQSRSSSLTHTVTQMGKKWGGVDGAYGAESIMFRTKSN